MKKIIVEYLVSSQKTAILEDDKLIELLIEDNKNSKKVSNIYRGVVKKVILGIQACFVDIGFEKLAYLQLDKDSNIKAGQDILVQVNKEEVGTKGAKLNTEISLAGRYLVYIPTNDRITISNKILDEKERFRLKKIANSVSKGTKGLIIRTEAVGCTKEELEADINELKERYEEIIKEIPEIRKRVIGYFTINTLEYLKRGGRIGRLAGTVGELLNLKPIITTDEDGVYYNVAKVRGRKQSLSKMTELLKGYLAKNKCEVAILHAGCEDEAIKYMNSLKDLTNIVSIKIAEISPALGIHGGPGLIGFSVKMVK